MLFSDFRGRGPLSIPTPPIVLLTGFFQADALASIHSLPVSWYVTSSQWVYVCSCKHIMLMLWSIVDAVSPGSCPIIFKVLTLNVVICIVSLHFSNFGLNSVADFSNTRARGSTSTGRISFLLLRRAMQFVQVVWVWVRVIFQWLFLFSSIEATSLDHWGVGRQS